MSTTTESDRPLIATTPDVDRARRQTIADLLHRSAARYPDREAIVDRDGARRTFRELDADASRIAHALRDRGIGVGDRVAILSRNSLPYVQAIFGAARSGAVLVPVNFMLGPAEVAYVLGHSGAVALLTEEGLRETGERALALVGTDDAPVAADLDPDRAPLRVVLGDAVPGWEPFGDLLAHEDADEPALHLPPDAPAQILYTSGTESRPKGAVLSHDALITQYATCVVEGRMAPDEVVIHALPLFHCAQQHVFLVPGVQLGARGVVLPAPDPATLLATIEEHRATTLFCPPTVWIGLLRHPDFDRRDLSSLAKGYYGAAIMPVEVLQELSRRLPDTRFWNFYGQTELAPVATVLPPEDQLRKPGSAGRAALNVETQVQRPDGTETDDGEIGEIVHRSPHATLGYLDAPEKTAAAFQGGWFHSGDLGVRDDEGYITVVDRIKDMIKTGGENVASREVEEAIYAHPAVAELAVVGISHPDWIEAVVAIVVLRDGESVNEDALRTHARERLAGFKVPKAFAFVDELPKNASGKILKRDLREAWAHLAERIPGSR